MVPHIIANPRTLFNPLSPNSDQHQFSPKDIHRLSRQMVMRINKMINKEKMSRSFIKFSQLILKGNVWRSVWRICMCILGLKGLRIPLQKDTLFKMLNSYKFKFTMGVPTPKHPRLR